MVVVISLCPLGNIYRTKHTFVVVIKKQYGKLVTEAIVKQRRTELSLIK